MHDRDDFGARGEEAVKFVHEQFAALVHGNDADFGAGLFGDELPGNDVGVVLHRGEEDFVAGLEESSAPRGRDEIDALRGSAGENNFARFGGIDEAGDFFAGQLVIGGCLLAEGVNAAMDVGVFVFVIIFDPIDDGQRFLRGGGVVEIDQRLAVDFCIEDGEMGAERRQVEQGGGSRRGCC